MTARLCLITGANGFLGSEIVRQMVGSGWQIRASDRQAASAFAGIDYRPADILEPTSFESIVQDVDYIVHAAGLAHIFGRKKAAGASFKEINEIGTANVARAAAKSGVKHFLLISSVSVYGQSRDGGHEDSGCYPHEPYALSKFQAEQRVLEIAEAAGMTLTILRIATAYGEGDPGNVARLMRAIDDGHFLWIGNGANRKSLVHREDVARACLAVADRASTGVSIYNVSGPPYTMRDIVEKLAQELGKKIPPVRIPSSAALRIAAILSVAPSHRLQGLGHAIKKWLADDMYDGSRFARDFGCEPKVGLSEGLRREVAWFRGQQK